MNVLLTGARGFIGRHTMAALLRDGHTVRPIDKKPDPDMASGGIWFDITDADRLAIAFETVKPWDVVIHLAANASLQRSMVAPAYDADQNVVGTINLLELCRKYGVPRFVFASTSAVYSPLTPVPYAETAHIQPVSPYGVGKAAAEMYVRQSGLKYSILRYANVYGPGQRAVGENALVARALDYMVHGKHFLVNGDGSQTRDWIFVADVAEANVLAAMGTPGTYNIGTGVGTSVLDVVGMLERCLDVEGPIQHGPPLLGELKHVVLNSEKAAERIPWRARTSLEDGLCLTAESWRRV